MNVDLLKADLIRDEGIRLKPYKDIYGNPTIGIGHFMTSDEIDRLKDGITLEEAHNLFDIDVQEAIQDVEKSIPQFISLSDSRQRVLMEMCFNMGLKRLLKFHKLLSAIVQGDMESAHDEILNSEYARELPTRVNHLAELWLNG